MERLTQRLRTGEVLMASEYEEKYTEQEWISVLQGRLAAYEDTELTPEEINDLASVREISPETEYAINKHADNIIERLDKLLHQTDDDARLRELAEADKEGRLFLLPMEPGRSMLCQEYFERPWVMKNVTLCVQYQSSAGIIFYMGYDVFCGLVERGRITPLSQEGEEMLEGKANV